jgi:hypothetical protein
MVISPEKNMEKSYGKIQWSSRSSNVKT